MKTRLTIAAALICAVFALSAGASSARIPVPGFGTDDVCACGGSWPQMTQCWSTYQNGSWVGFYGYDGGPGSSPRYYTSWWQASYNLCG